MFNFVLLIVNYWMETLEIFLSALVHIYQRRSFVAVCVIKIGKPFDIVRIVCSLHRIVTVQLLHSERDAEIELIQIDQFHPLPFILHRKTRNIGSIPRHQIPTPYAAVPDQKRDKKHAQAEAYARANLLVAL